MKITNFIPVGTTFVQDLSSKVTYPCHQSKSFSFLNEMDKPNQLINPYKGEGEKGFFPQKSLD